MSIRLLKSQLALSRIAPYERMDFSLIEKERRNLELLLLPFLNLKTCFDQLLSLVQDVLEEHSEVHYKLVLKLIRLRFKKPPQQTDFHKIRWSVLRRINRAIQEEHSGLWEMEKHLFRSVGVSAKVVANFKHEQQMTLNAEAKYAFIVDAIQKISFMGVCTSVFHRAQGGCPICHVVFIGAVNAAYVQAIDRSDGTITLRPIEFELGLLLREEIEQKTIVADLAQALTDTEVPLKHSIALALQKWWCCRLSRKRNFRSTVVYQRSLYFFRIRRLVKMKRFIDVLFISVKNARLMVKMNVDYKEYASEYAEYSERVVQVRQSRIERIWKKYIEKCKDSMIRSNMARYALEEEELGDHLKREQLRLKVVDEKRLLMLRRRLQRMETQTFICYDIDCKRRQFISQKRYNIHQELHAASQRKRAAQLDVIDERRKANEVKEAAFLWKLYEYRVHDAYLTMVDDL